MQTFWLFRLIAAYALLSCLVMPVRAQDEVVAEEDVATVDDAEAATFTATPIAPRQADGKRYFARQSSDAFVDPDQRQSLELKYYFVLDDDHETLARELAACDPRAAIQGEVATAAGAPAPLAALAERINAQGDAPAQLAWLDRLSESPRQLLVLDLAGSGEVKPALSLVRTKETADKLELSSSLATRPLEPGEIYAAARPGATLATWDIPEALASKAFILNRLVALLKTSGGRSCVDFYGGRLNADSDCRVWLTPAGDPLGEPVGIRFTELPVRRENGSISPVAVLKVYYANPTTHKLRAIACEFPLCRPAIMEQLARSQANKATPPGKAPAGPDLVKLVGPDLLEELSRRLVNGVYR